MHARGLVTLLILGCSLGAAATTEIAWAQAKPRAGAADEKKDEKADRKEAGAHFKKGKELFAKKSFKEARDEFKAAEDLIPAGPVEYYIGRCSEELGDAADAAGWYQKGLDSGKLKTEEADDTTSRLNALKARPAKLHVTSDPPGAAVAIDGKATGQQTPYDVDLPPGPHKVGIDGKGSKPFEQDVDLAPIVGAIVTAKLEPAPIEAADDPFKNKPPPEPSPPTPVPPPKPAETKRDMTWVYITAAGAVVGAGVGTYFGIKALADKKDFDNTQSIPANAAHMRELKDDGSRNALVADMAFGIGLTLAVTSAVLLFGNDSDSASTGAASRRLAFAPMFGPSQGGRLSAGASASVHF